MSAIVMLLTPALTAASAPLAMPRIQSLENVHQYVAVPISVGRRAVMVMECASREVRPQYAPATQASSTMASSGVRSAVILCSISLIVKYALGSLKSRTSAARVSSTACQRLSTKPKRAKGKVMRSKRRMVASDGPRGTSLWMDIIGDSRAPTSSWCQPTPCSASSSTPANQEPS